MIQGSINQLLNLAAVGYRLSPEYERNVKLRDVEARLTGMKEQAELIDQRRGEFLTPAEYDELDILGENIIEASRERFAINPTKETAEKHFGNVRANEARLQRREEMMKPVVTPADPAEIEYERAMMDMEARTAIREKELAGVRQNLLSNAPKSKATLKTEKEELSSVYNK